MLAEDDFLEHFGVKGMKWGVRNEDRAASKLIRNETHAQKFDAKAKATQAKIDAIDANPGNFLTRNARASQRADLVEQKQRHEKDAQLKRDGKLSTGQRRALIGGGAAVAFVAAYGTYTLAQSGEMHRSATKGKMFLQGKKGESPWSKKDILSSKDMDVDDIFSNVVKQVNPDYGAVGTKVNCRRCTFAYEMRRRGYDVAATKTSNGSGQTTIGVINATRPGEKIIPSSKVGSIFSIVKEQADNHRGKIDSTPLLDAVNQFGGASVGAKNAIEGQPSSMASSIFRGLAKNPDGARGELGLTWSGGGGHSMAWEVIKGKTVIFDTQSGKKYDGVSALQKEFGSTIKEAAYTRLDNVPLNEDFLMRWLKNAGS